MRAMTREEIVDLVETSVERAFREFLDGDHERRVERHRQRAEIFGEGSEVAKRCDLLARLIEGEPSDK